MRDKLYPQVHDNQLEHGSRFVTYSEHLVIVSLVEENFSRVQLEHGAGDGPRIDSVVVPMTHHCEAHGAQK